MELINEVPPIKVEGRIVACEGGQFLSVLSLAILNDFFFGVYLVFAH